MKKLICILTFFISSNIYSQVNNSTEIINWFSLEKAQKYSKKYNQNILIYFYKKDCQFCDRMQNETLSDPEVIKIINENFIPVKIDGYTKKVISFNGDKYSNQQPIEDGYSFRHDLYFNLGSYDNKIITPTIVIIDDNLNKSEQFTGFHPKIQLLRKIKNITQ
tara:strand:+ start:7315 stop:7803 length:489 start_codon:yes stop_codon:yes gene_type:complete